MVTPSVVRTWTPLVMRACMRTDARVVHVMDYNYSGCHELVLHWNKLYGLAGMVEFQFALPGEAFSSTLEELVQRAERRSVPLLGAVVKRFGTIAPVGMLSFPMPGYTISLQTK